MSGVLLRFELSYSREDLSNLDTVPDPRFYRQSNQVSLEIVAFGNLPKRQTNG